MMTEWIRFWITAILMTLALVCFFSAVVGSYKFGFIMNCLHAAGIGDTLGLLCVITALIVSCNNVMWAAKLLLIVAFLWCTSPVSTHFIGQAEYFLNDHIEQNYHREGGITDESAGNS